MLQKDFNSLLSLWGITPMERTPPSPSPILSGHSPSPLVTQHGGLSRLQARKRVGMKKRKEEEHSRRAQVEQSASQWLEERRSQELRRKMVGIKGKGSHDLGDGWY